MLFNLRLYTRKCFCAIFNAAREIYIIFTLRHTAEKQQDERRNIKMIKIRKEAIIFAAGLAAGVGTYVFVKSGMAKKTAVAITAKGIQLQQKVNEIASLAKESVEDIAAEAKEAAK